MQKGLIYVCVVQKATIIGLYYHTKGYKNRPIIDWIVKVPLRPIGLYQRNSPVYQINSFTHTSIEPLKQGFCAYQRH